MADEQPPHSDLIDDAIRQAERQLEEKLEALRLSALGDSASPAAPSDDAAHLVPTGSSSSDEERSAAARAHESAYEAVADAAPEPETAFEPAAAVWQELPGDDLSFAPAAHEPSPTDEALDEALATVEATTAFDPSQLGERPAEPAWDDEPSEHVEAYAPEAIDDATADPQWEPAPTPAAEYEPPVEQIDPSSLRATTSWVPDAAPEREPDDSAWDRPEPVHSTWTSNAPSGAWQQAHEQVDRAPSAMLSIPTEDELEFWAHTRSALRNLQVSTDLVPSALMKDLGIELGQLMRDELVPLETVLDRMQSQIDRSLPQIAQQVEVSIDSARAAATSARSADAAMVDLAEQLPRQLAREASAAHDSMRSDVDGMVAAAQAQLQGHVDSSASMLHAAIQQDVARIEESVATNVTRMAVGTTDAVARLEANVDRVGDGVARVERGIGTSVERLEHQLRGSIEQAQHALRDQIDAPAKSIARLEEDLPAAIERIEQAVSEKLAASQTELSSMLTGLVDSNRASLDRVAAVASTLDEERTRRAEDVATIVDTVTTGWEGLAGAIKALYEQHADTSRRIEAIEGRLGQLRDLEGAVQNTMTQLRDVVGGLTPAPVVVTVAHPDAEVANTARGGWVAAPGTKMP